MGIATVVNALHPLKTLLPIVVTLAGMLMLRKAVQPQKAPLSILVRPVPRVTEVKPVNPRNASVFIQVTVLGIITLVTLVLGNRLNVDSIVVTGKLLIRSGMRMATAVPEYDMM